MLTLPEFTEDIYPPGDHYGLQREYIVIADAGTPSRTKEHVVRLL